ncbi:MAG: two-component sensor histidine kinase [uncultured bacterium]|nr:MAG: two-component sensor histidine kinase [uncultured bacterium]
MIINGLEFYKDIFENIPEGILLCSIDFMIIDANKSFEELTDFKKEELIGKYTSELIELDKVSCPACSGKKDSTYMPEQFVHIAEIKDKNNNKIPVRINHKSTDNCFIFVISALSNIACLNQAHIDFVSTVSHELRTPLTSIKGFADTLLTAGDKLDAEKQRRFISIIKSQIDRLTRLVENLLTVSRLESKKDKSIYKAVNFKEFLDRILQNLSPKAGNHNIKVEIMPNLPPIWVDTDKFEQIITNLVDNAIKYSNKGTSITIKAGFAPDNTDFIEIKVMDQGVGIPKEFLSNIFTKFSRIDNPLTRQTEGTGLGLYITKSLVENMGGKISVNSNGKQGSVFTVMLSVANPEKHAAQKFLEK